MNVLANDIRYAIRQLRRSPGFAATAVFTLALGIGATAAVYSVIQSVLLQALPYPDSNSLVGVAYTFPHEKPNAEQAGSTADFVREHSNEFSSVAIMDDSSPAVNLSLNGRRAIQVNALRVSEGYFRTLGVMPALGRAFLPDEDRPNGAKALVLSHDLWTNVFNGDSAVVGRAIRVNQETFTVVGVMPAGFTVTAETAPGVLGTPALWQPLQLGPKDPGYDGDNYEMIARLRQGVTLAQAQSELSMLNAPFYQANPTYTKWFGRNNELHEFRAWKLQDVVVSEVRRSLLTVMGAVLAVLLVACLNLAGLMVARSMRRSREIAMRSALGATGGHLVRMLACEGLLLAFFGGVLALLVARVATRILLHAAPLAVPSLHGDPSIGPLCGVVFLVSLAATGIFSVLPAWLILRKRNRETRLGSPSFGETVSHARLSRTLMVAQIALAMALVSVASMLLGTFLKLRSVPSGIAAKQLSVFQVDLKGNRYANTRQTTQFVSSVLENLRHTPGVERVAAVNGLPLDRGLNIGGNPTDRHDIRQIIELRSVTPSYFQTMGIPLLSGRDFSDSDRAGGDLVIVIGAEAARKWWPGRSPIGDSIKIGGEHSWRIVGIAADVHTHSLVETGNIVIYAPMSQLSDEMSGIINGWFPTSFAIRTAADVNLAATVQRAVEQADPEIPVARLTTMQAVIDSTIEQPRFFSLLASGFSVFAMILTVIGLFGLLSYQVTQRTREIGVRMALGADRRAILGVFLGRGLTVAFAGVALGLAASWLVRPVVSHLLADAGVNPAGSGAVIVMNGVWSAVAASVAILLATLGASWFPARRAASIDPMRALRTE
ncbi:ABC transporter permease [Telmatobacter sp. DSM 110680]|uniref:ABC transporter permease n=1 Tax=Telmatobacter sp. DSM 110680 TaxID=3036704 RepID=A0AAU7DQN8_9BACT